MHEKKLDFTNEIENFWQERPSLLKMNAAGTVPVLVDLNGAVISDDTAITEYLEEVYPEKKFLHDSIAQKTEIRRLIGWFDKKFYKEVSEPIFVEKVIKRFKKDHGLGGPNSILLRSAKASISFHLEYISWLCDRRNWLGGEEFSLADIAAAAHLSMVDYFGDVPWDRHVEAKNWYVRIKSRPTFRIFFTDRLPGFPPSETYENLDF
ncbi:MAG: FtsZ-localized protein A [Holosporales bacterium]